MGVALGSEAVGVGFRLLAEAFDSMCAKQRGRTKIIAIDLSWNGFQVRLRVVFC